MLLCTLEKLAVETYYRVANERAFRLSFKCKIPYNSCIKKPEGVLSKVSEWPGSCPMFR